MGRLSAGQSLFLDALRYLAALMVAFHHGLAYFYREEFYYEFSQAHPYTNLGTMGVGAFFLLSGFLIAYTVRRKDGPDYGFGVFATERFVRIYLVFAPAIALAVGLNFLNLAWLKDTMPGMELFTVHNVAATLAMLSGVDGVTGHSEIFPLIGPAWTINYEFWFYMVFGLLMLPFRALPVWASWALRVVLLVCVVALCLTLDAVRELSLLWAAGAVAGLGFAFGRFVIGVAVGAALLSTPFLFQPETTERTLTYLGLFAALVSGLWLFARIAAGKTVTGIVARLAGFSYSLYITHVMVIWLLRHWGHFGDHFSIFENDNRKLTAFAITMVATNLFALGFAMLTEDHTNSVRRFFLGRGAKRAAEPAAAT